MVRFAFFPIVLATAFTAILCVTIPAQMTAQATPKEIDSGGMKLRLVPPEIPPMPFSTDTPNRQSVNSIEFRPAGQMTERDRNLAANAEASIGEHTGLAAFDFEQGGWSYQQVVCPALPNHLFLQYTRNNGTGDVTVFSASIPRDGEGRVRIIPILRRGYSLFSPAPINALTVSAFNHIRAEEPPGRPSDWLGTGLCYAALAGARPQISAPDAQLTSQKRTPALTPTLEVPVRGGEIIKFADGAATPRPMEWTMTFTYRGKLIKATHTPATLVTFHPVPQKSAVSKSWSVAQDAQDASGGR